MRNNIGFFVSATLLLAGCGAANGPETSQTKALVSSSQARKAFDIVKAIDYIPFNYIIDGCYARSLYMSMELAAEGIPSSSHYIFGYLLPTQSVSWGYHVAPLLKIKGEEPWILDPAFQTEPLRLSSWIDKNNSLGSYTTEIKAGSAYFDEAGRTSEFNNDHMIQNFAEMPTFLTSDISSACATMWNYIANQYSSADQTRTVRAKLIARTTELAGRLADLRKLDVDGASYDSNYSCRRALGL